MAVPCGTDRIYSSGSFVASSFRRTALPIVIPHTYSEGDAKPKDTSMDERGIVTLTDPNERMNHMKEIAGAFCVTGSGAWMGYIAVAFSILQWLERQKVISAS